MKLKIASFNISGGFYCGDEKTEYLDRQAVDNIDNSFLKEIIDLINTNEIDIMCFQEIVTTDRVEYISRIIKNTNLKYSSIYELSPCNLIKDTNCGLAILSKYPILVSKKEKFTNPMLSKTTSSGNTYYTYDKGYIICHIDLDGKIIKVLTHHGFPYRRFNSQPENNKRIFEEFDNIIDKENPDIITGDFNADNFMALMNYTRTNYIRTIDDITTVDGRKFDDILVSKERINKSKIIQSLSDHYLIVNEIEI